MDDILIKKLSEYFNITAFPEKAFSRILNFSLDEIENMMGKISDSDYFESFFVSTLSIERKAELIIKDILKGEHKFLFLHGYAKNGKTTFSYYLNYKFKKEIHNHNLDVIIHRFNFNIQDPHNGNVKLNLTFLDAVKEWLLQELDTIHDDIKVVNNIISFHEFIESNKIPLEGNNIISIRHGNSLFDKIGDKLINLALHTKSKYVIRVVNYKTYFKNNISDILSELDDNDCSDVLTYLIFFKVYSSLKESHLKHGKKRKILFVFDNIDDILAPAAINIQGNYILELIYQIPLFQEIFGEALKREINGFNISEDIRFLFQFRSANLVNAIIQREDSASSRKDRYDEYILSPVYTVSTINSSSDIIKQRFHIYEELMNYNKKAIFRKVSIFKRLFATDLREVAYKGNFVKINKLLKIWNGNRAMALKNFPYDKFDNIDLPHEKEYRYLLIGSMLNVFLTPYKADEDLYPSLNLFLKANSANLCNLTRLILTQIYNSTNQHRRFNNVGDIRKKGMPLYEILKKLFDLKDINGKYVYEKTVIKQAFSQMFDGQIDDWRELITCTKSTINNQGDISVQGKHINLDSEIELFYNEYNENGDNSKLVNSLQHVRLLYNDSADYLITDVITSFEFINLFELDKTCLLFQIWEQIEKNNLDYFLDKIKNVFTVVEEITSDSVTHYIKDFSLKYKPEEYCTKSGFAINEKFMFEWMISRHSTYLDQFRHYILNKKHTDDSSKIKNQELKILINKNMIEVIEKYIFLFDILFAKIVNANLEPSKQLLATKRSFTKGVNEKIKLIKNSDYSDFDIMLWE